MIHLFPKHQLPSAGVSSGCRRSDILPIGNSFANRIRNLISRCWAIALCLIVFNGAAASLTLSTNRSVEDLGVLIGSVAMDPPIALTNTAERHLLLNYWGGAANNILDVNLDQGTTRVARTHSGRSGLRGWAFRDGIVYYFIPNSYYGLNGHGTNAYQGFFGSYNVNTGQTNFIRMVGQYQGYHADWGDDGWLYIGAYASSSENGRGAYVDRYNPNTGVYEEIGGIDPATEPDYVYSLGADSRYLYACGAYNWHLSVWDSQSGSNHFTQFWSQDSDSNGYIYRGKKGGWYYRKQGPVTSGLARWYALSNGVPNLVSTNAAVQANFHTNVWFSEGVRGGLVDNAVTQTNTTGFSFDLDLAYPDSSNNVVNVGYMANGIGTWNYRSATNFNLGPASLKRIYPDGDGLFITTYAYGPWLNYSFENNRVTRYGTPPYSMYDAVKISNVWYVLGYDAATLRFDPTLPWTLSASTPNRNDPSVNPHKLGLSLRTHEYYSCVGSDGQLYVASHVDRNGVGGRLGWQDIIYKTNGSLPLPQTYLDVADLKPLWGGSNLVYSCLGSNLLVFDCKTKAFLSTNAPLGLASPGKITEVSPGIILGFSGTTIYKWNCNTGTLLASTNVNEQVFGAVAPVDRRVELAPDGYAWLFVGTTLYRLNPGDMSMASILTKNPALNIAWHSTNLYLYGGSSLYRIQGILKPKIRPPSDLHALEP